MGNNEMQQLRADLAQFRGTANYYRIDRKTLLTDGTYYLCEQAGAYWLITVFVSYLHELKLEDWFTVLKLDVTGSSAKVTISDGNDNVLAVQEIEYTDFPLPHLNLYGSWDGENWVLMLPSEY